MQENNISFYKTFFLLCLLTLMLPSNGNASKPAKQVQVNQVVSGLGIPWGMAFLTETELLITEKRGRLKLAKLDGSGEIISVTGLPDIMQIGQGGLLDIQVEPGSVKNKANPVLYFTYVGKSTKGVAKGLPTLFLAKAELTGSQLSNLQVLFEANQAQRGSRHFGSRITFDGEGHVYFSMGDRGERLNSQNLSKHSGSIFRLKLDGSVPTDNPFINIAGKMPEIWSYGHRNPQGLYYDRDSQRLWSIEHGPRGGDEINLVEKGNNYGWPIISYGREYITNLKVSKDTHKEGMEQPVYYYIPSIAPSSLMHYSGKKFTQWQGHLFSGALKLRHLNVVKLDKQGQVVAEFRLFEELNSRIRNVVESPAGEIYFSTDDGNIFKIMSQNNS